MMALQPSRLFSFILLVSTSMVTSFPFAVATVDDSNATSTLLASVTAETSTPNIADGDNTEFIGDQVGAITSNGPKREARLRLKQHLTNLDVVKERMPPVPENEHGDELPVAIHVSASVLSVLSVNEARRTMTTELYMAISWTDDAMSWNASHYAGIKRIYLPVDSVWTPRINVVNSLDTSNIVKSSVNDVLVSSDGAAKITVIPFVESFCSLDLTRFPYDQQECLIMFMAPFVGTKWTFEEMQRANLVIWNYIEQSSEWDIVSLQVVVLSSGTNKTGDLPQMVLGLRRRTTFYTVCLVLPMVLTSYMNTLVFLLPLQSGEKVSFLVTLSVSTSVFIGFFSSLMPRGLDNVPSTMKLMIGVIVQSLLFLLATIVVLQRQQHEEETTKCDPAVLIGCCVSRGSRVHAFTSVTEKETAENETKTMNNLGRSKRWSAARLDRVFFVLAFVSNTVFLLVLVFASLLPAGNK